MRLGEIELFCADVESTRDFYTDLLGFESVEEEHSVQLCLGNLNLVLKPGQLSQSSPYHSAQTALVLYTTLGSDIKAAFESAGIPYEMDNANPPGILIQDPDRRWIQIIEHS